ncbi:MAG: helix-turn-helix domain-containing protein [Clostridiales bacterium]|jgi:transcriptional regulator with XRE-family HTH domain|nr:helix-turn-helix domain-containing protein [Clostridiales bacterium]
MLRISQRIKHYRQKKGLTQEAVANALGVRKENYAKYESGERNPKDERLIEIAKILDVSYNALEEGVEWDFIDLLHRHIRGVVMDDAECFRAFHSDVIENEVFKDIAKIFTFWSEKFEIEDKTFFKRYLIDSSINMESLLYLHKLYMSALEDRANQNIKIKYDHKLEAHPRLEEEAKYRLAFCIAMTKYLSKYDYEAIWDEACKMMSSERDVSPLQFFAVKLFVPFLSYITDTVEMTMWNSTIDDFEMYFLYGALTDHGNENFNDDSEDSE